jgi:hypothetical protein
MVQTFENLLGIAKVNYNTSAVKRYTKLLAKARALAKLMDPTAPSKILPGARNYQPNQRACFSQCRTIEGCVYGTWETANGQTPGECWLSKHTPLLDHKCKDCISFKIG